MHVVFTKGISVRVVLLTTFRDGAKYFIKDILMYIIFNEDTLVHVVFTKHILLHNILLTTF